MVDAWVPGDGALEGSLSLLRAHAARWGSLQSIPWYDKL